MVKTIEVKNFKSIVDLKLELGRVNVFIGENGSGKSNILEAVAFGAAASADKLDKEFLASRGMRVPEAKLMRSAFNKGNLEKRIIVVFDINAENKNEVEHIEYALENRNKDFSEWENFGKLILPVIQDTLKNIILSKPNPEKREVILSNLNRVFGVKQTELELIRSLMSDVDSDDIDFNLNVESNYKQPVLNSYKIFAPENTFLRKFEDEEAGDPLGIRGEGLFRLLRYFLRHEDKKYIEAIKEAMTALDWFEDFNIADDLSAGERKLRIIDRFLDPEVSISQNSANEGFLFILFYLSLFVSPDTPPFFAIDNLDASFNPKLCKHITRVLTKTAKDFNKQALFTTHNPFILDGLDLSDDEQRLFVVYRSQQGHTIAKRVMPNDRKMPFSEQWMNGYLGGLPQNF